MLPRTQITHSLSKETVQNAEPKLCFTKTFRQSANTARNLKPKEAKHGAMNVALTTQLQMLNQQDFSHARSLRES